MLKKLKVYLGLSDADADEILSLMLDDAAQAALCYCHIKKLNTPLETVAVQAAMRKFKEENEGLIESLKMGDVAISYKSPIGADCFTESEKTILNAYRRVIAK